MNLINKLIIDIKLGNPYFSFAVILSALIIIGLLYLTITIGESRPIVGTVNGLSMDTGEALTMSNLSASVKLPSGKIVPIELPTGINIKLGDKVTLIESEFLITNGKKYTYSNY